MVADTDNLFFSVAFGARVKEAREKAKLSQSELAKRLGLTRSSVANIEAGRQHPTVERAAMIVRVVRCDPGWLLAGPTHVRVEDPRYGEVCLSSCDKHLPVARAAGKFLQEHTFEGWCGFPASLWSPELNVCFVDDTGVEPVRCERAEAVR